MSTAKITFEVEGAKHSLYFGMAATEIIKQKSIIAAANKSIDNLKAFAYILFGGMCNYADMMDEQRPTYTDAYMLMESIATDEELTSRIYSTWENAKPTADLMKLLNADKKKADENQSQTTGI